MTGVSVINANMTARFTLNIPFGGTLTANIAAGAITDAFGNPNAAFSGNYTVQGCPPQDHYTIAQIGGSIVPGTADTGNHADDLTTAVVIPFSYTLYGTSFTTINVSSNGNAQFTTTDTAFTNVCPLPWTTHNSTIFPYWDDQRTDTQTGCAAFPGGVCGIFTSVSGVAPNRIFNIEWRTVYFSSTTTTANHELRLYEGQTRFDVIYGTLGLGNTSATAGVQKDNTTFDSVLLQRLRWCGYWRAKLHTANLRSPAGCDQRGIAQGARRIRALRHPSAFEREPRDRMPRPRWRDQSVSSSGELCQSNSECERARGTGAWGRDADGNWLSERDHDSWVDGGSGPDRGSDPAADRANVNERVRWNEQWGHTRSDDSAGRGLGRDRQ